MGPLLEGALVGAGLGLFLYAAEYLILRGHVNERAKRYKKPAVFDQTERKRLRAIGSFSMLLPFILAVSFWIFDKAT